MNNDQTKNKEVYIRVFGLSRGFTLEQLISIFESKMLELKAESEDFLDKAILYNDTLHILRNYASDRESSTIFSDKECNKFGMNFNEVTTLNKKFNLNDNIKKLIEDISILYDQVEENKKNIISMMLQSDSVMTIPYDRLFGMYYFDMKNTCTFEQYIKALVNACNNMVKLSNGNKHINLKECYEKYMKSSDTSFLASLSNLLEIEFLCKELGEKEYELKYKYEYELEEGSLSFLEYLRNLCEIKNICKDLLMTKEQVEEGYINYKKIGSTGNKLDFLREFHEAMKYCSGISSIYYVYKERYNNLEPSKRTSSFILYLQINHIIINNSLSYEKIIETMYFKSVEQGFNGSMDEYIKNLMGCADTKESKIIS